MRKLWHWEFDVRSKEENEVFSEEIEIPVVFYVRRESGYFSEYPGIINHNGVREYFQNVGF